MDYYRILIMIMIGGSIGLGLGNRDQIFTHMESHYETRGKTSCSYEPIRQAGEDVETWWARRYEWHTKCEVVK